MKIKLWFDIEAGKFDGGEKNCKYCNSVDNVEVAAALYEKVVDYSWATLEVVVGMDGTVVERKELMRNYPRWRDVQHDFHSNGVSWTRTYESLLQLMSQEEALACLAENFDRRPAIEVMEA